MKAVPDCTQNYRNGEISQFEHDSNNADAAGSSVWSNLIMCTNIEQKVIRTDNSKVINKVGFIAHKLFGTLNSTIEGI
jgi:hypothetical protein